MALNALSAAVTQRPKLVIVQSERPILNRSVLFCQRHPLNPHNDHHHSRQLEQTVTKLQTALGYSPEQVSALPPPLVKIRELEQEVTRLQKENDDLRNLVAETNGRGLPGDFTRRNSYGSYQDSRLCDRNDYKRRKHVDGVYLVSNPPPPTFPTLNISARLTAHTPLYSIGPQRCAAHRLSPPTPIDYPSTVDPPLREPAFWRN